VIERTHIRVSKETKSRLDEWRGTGQSYDGAIRELLGLVPDRGAIRNSPLFTELSDESQVPPNNEARNTAELMVETDRGTMMVKCISLPNQTYKCKTCGQVWAPLPEKTG